MSEENIATYQPMERRRSRPLGLLETMYHTFNCRDIDVCPMFFRISCKYPVTRHHVKVALFQLAEEFTALRLTIVQTGQHTYKFVEKKHMPVSIKERHIKTKTPMLSQECFHRFDFSRGPLWKFTWLKYTGDSENSTEHLYPFQFFFTFHHAIADFQLSRIFVCCFLQNILYSQGALSECVSQRRHLHPCVEHVIPLDLIRPKHELKGHKSYPRYALDMYNVTFSSEISTLKEKQISTEISVINLTEAETMSFFQQCKEHDVKVTAALTAAMTLSFTQLIRKAIPLVITNFVVPTEIMVDLRRYMLDKRTQQSFGSVGAVHMPLQVDIDLSGDVTSKSLYWSVATQCQNKLDEDLAKGEPMRVLREQIPSEIQNPPMTGKSPSVLTLTNLGYLNDIVPESCNNLMKLDEFIPWSNVNIDDMPIFYIGPYTINKKLTMAVGFCGSYTSHQTTGQFTWTLINILKNCSKL